MRKRRLWGEATCSKSTISRWQSQDLMDSKSMLFSTQKAGPTWTVITEPVLSLFGPFPPVQGRAALALDQASLNIFFSQSENLCPGWRGKTIVRQENMPLVSSSSSPHGPCWWCLSCCHNLEGRSAIRKAKESTCSWPISGPFHSYSRTIEISFHFSACSGQAYPHQ